MTITITHYTDFKSPYAYLAKDATYALEDRRDVVVDWLPYSPDIADFLGSAELDERGNVVRESPRSDRHAAPRAGSRRPHLMYR